ncbi:hypothetical protein B0H13DRAFT_2674439 [Mycena leptocephala]|nr:hypothetical protein B0H13DRAFT_2674439 [Mycena leptocephala]
MTWKAAEEMRHIAACVLRLFGWIVYWSPPKPPGPERHAAYEDIFGRRPAPRTGPSPQPPQRPYAAYPNPNPQGYHPHPKQYQRPPAPPYHPHPHPHAYLPHPQQQPHAPQYGNGGGYPGGPASIRAPSLRPSYQPGVPTPAPHRPTNAQVAMFQQGQQP